MTDEIKTLQDAMKGQTTGLPAGFAVEDLGSQMRISRMDPPPVREYTCSLYAYSNVCQAIQVFCGPAPAPRVEPAGNSTETAKDCARCGKSVSAEGRVACTGCNGWFCENCNAEHDCVTSTPETFPLTERGKVPAPIYDVKNPPKYEARAVKYHSGMEGTGFNADLYRDGVKIAHVLDEGSGGSMMFYFEQGPDGKRHNGTEDALYDNFARNQPPLEPSPGMESFGPLPMDMDMYFHSLLDRFDELKDLKKWCKNGTVTVFRLKGDSKTVWHTANVPYGPHVKEQLVRQYGGQLEEIANERPGLQVAAPKKTRGKKR